MRPLGKRQIKSHPLERNFHRQPSALANSPCPLGCPALPAGGQHVTTQPAAELATAPALNRLVSQNSNELPREVKWDALHLSNPTPQSETLLSSCGDGDDEGKAMTQQNQNPLGIWPQSSLSSTCYSGSFQSMMDKDLIRISTAACVSPESGLLSRADRKLFVWILEPEQNWNKKGKAIDHVGPPEEACDMHPRKVHPGDKRRRDEPCTGQGPALALGRVLGGSRCPGRGVTGKQQEPEPVAGWSQPHGTGQSLCHDGRLQGLEEGVEARF